MNQIQNTMNDLHQLHLEAATLSRLIYRTKHKFRQEKSFKALQKINRCLTNYQTMHLPFTVSSIRDTLHADQGPTRQMMEWALVKLYGVAHLFHRVYLLCIEAAGHLFVKIKLAHIWELAFFSIATVSRIWTFSQFLVLNACEWYSNLYQYLDKLQSSSAPWLPNGCALPADLTQTIENSQYLKLKTVNEPSKLLSHINFSLPENDKVQVSRNLNAIFDMIDDVGEPIQRDSSQKHSTVQQNLKDPSCKRKKHKSIQKEVQKSMNTNSLNKKYDHSIKNIQSSQDLLKFIQIEATFQNMSNTGASHQPILRKMDKLQWSVVNKFIQKQMKIIRKTEEAGTMEQQEKLLKRVRKYIKKWVS